MRLRRVLGWVLLLAAAPLVVIACVATVFYVVGNGPNAGALALATLPVLGVLGPYVVAAPRPRLARLVLALLAADLAYAAWRVTRVGPDARFPVCVDGVCPAEAPVLARLVREDETANAGMALSTALGLLSPHEERVIVPATRAVYADLAARRHAAPGPNALALASSADRVTSLVWLPPGEGRVPALVFLHGFGGLLTPYLSVLAASPLGERYAIVAPALDMAGYWWEPAGRAVLARTLDTLPARVDRDDLWLVGLSNGAIGANRLAADPALGPRFRGTILLVGALQIPDEPAPRGPVLLVPGLEDPRFPIAYVEASAAAMRDAGVEVTWAPVAGDHFVLFTHTDQVTATMAWWLEARARAP